MSCQLEDILGMNRHEDEMANKMYGGNRRFKTSWVGTELEDVEANQQNGGHRRLKTS